MTPSSDPAPPLPAPLVAIVDDDPPFLDAMLGLMRALGWRSAGFASAESFLASPARAEAACIVSDLQMPGMDGLALLSRLARDGGAAPVILVTARTEPRLEDEARARGALCLLRKPVAPEALEACLARAMGAGPG
ncbi:MAG: response regulator [Pseudomonadota bacterium]|nr:response regulator [Pseudomonadota bacterium]MEE3099589.1 response regulator [Pseudomonadota bacterium]